jgi:hypothetical protein
VGHEYRTQPEKKEIAEKPTQSECSFAAGTQLSQHHGPAVNLQKLKVSVEVAAHIFQGCSAWV